MDRLASRAQISDLIATFPNLASSPFELTSPEDANYNCVAWAVADTGSNWWPTTRLGSYWPRRVHGTTSLQTIVQLFVDRGFARCAVDEAERTRDAILIYCRAGAPLHVARSLGDGRWTSKLGASFDLTHTVIGLTGAQYGQPELAMRPQPART
jgi:hypothetical protein